MSVDFDVTGAYAVQARYLAYRTALGETKDLDPAWAGFYRAEALECLAAIEAEVLPEVKRVFAQVVAYAKTIEVPG